MVGRHLDKDLEREHYPGLSSQGSMIEVVCLNLKFFGPEKGWVSMPRYFVVWLFAVSWSVLDRKLRPTAQQCPAGGAIDPTSL